MWKKHKTKIIFVFVLILIAGASTGFYFMKKKADEEKEKAEQAVLEAEKAKKEAEKIKEQEPILNHTALPDESMVKDTKKMVEDKSAMRPK